MTVELKKPITPEEGADWWRDVRGMNVLPADVCNPDKTKRNPLGLELCGHTWNPWKTEPIPRELHEAWKKGGYFKKGMAVICGQVMHLGQVQRPLFLNGIDCDNMVASGEFWKDGLENKTLIEQHTNTPSKCHIFYYTEVRPMKQRKSDEGGEESKGNDINEIPIVEVQSGGQLMFVTPSPHRDKSNYEIIGTDEILNVPVEQLEKMVDDVCEEFGLHYLKSPMITLNKKIENLQFKTEGTNRQDDLVSIVTTFALRNKDDLDEDDIINHTLKLNQKLGASYPEERAIQIGKSCYKYAHDDGPSPEAEIKSELKVHWMVIKNKQSTEEEKNAVKVPINELEKLLGVVLTSWDGLESQYF